MKFSIAVNMERFDPSQDMRQVTRDALELVRLAEEGGFEIAWAAEHHTIELTIGPNPFTILTHWAAHTSRIRLGTAVVVAPYWHPIRVAGEAALFDIFSDGRLEFGIGRGAFQYQFDRMAGGLEQQRGGLYMREMLPVVLGLWRGDVAHHGEIWSFPTGYLGAEAAADTAPADLGGDPRSEQLRLGHAIGRQYHGDPAVAPTCRGGHSRPDALPIHWRNSLASGGHAS